MYIPKGSITLDKAVQQQIRLGIQGYPGTGKTYAALSFPNPTVFNLDRGLGAHIGRSDVLEVPAWDSAWCKSIYPKYKGPEDLKDVIWMWLTTEAVKLEADQTLVFDGNTGLQKAWESYIDYPANKPVTKNGSFDDFAPWRLKIGFYSDVCEYFKRLRCHVVFLSHEADKKDKDGSYSGKIRPLLTGQFNDQIIGHFTDWFRSRAEDKLPADKLTDDILRHWKLTKTEFVDMQAEFPRNTIYFWQTDSDTVFDGKTSSLIDFPRFIPSTYKHFNKYLRQISKP